MLFPLLKHFSTSCDNDCNDNDPTLETHDVDNDGFSTCDGDCDDNDPNTFEGAAQYDSSNRYKCVGCGRCIRACPAQIDITEVAREIRRD